VTYCPKTFRTGRSLEERPERVVPYPEPITVSADEVVIVEVERTLGVGSLRGTQRDTYCLPITEAAGLVLGMRITKAVKLG
jgi:hypothetical protein